VRSIHLSHDVRIHNGSGTLGGLVLRSWMRGSGATVFIATLGFAVTTVQGQGTDRRLLRGSVVDTAGVPVPFANLLQSGGRRVFADDSGRFTAELRARDRVTFDVRRIGYRPSALVVPPGNDTVVTVVLVPTAVELEGRVVTGTPEAPGLRMAGFYRRLQDREKGINAGHFLTAEDIERRKPTRITQMLEGLPGVRVMRFRMSLGKMSTGSECMSQSDPRCWVPVGAGNCPMMVYVDGRRLNTLRTHSSDAWAFGVDEVALPTHVAGIEVYSTAGRVPPEYQLLSGTCGAVLIWTK
jgi:hypothetical protein